MTIHDVIAAMKQLGQRQDGTTDQLIDLKPFADKLGLAVPEHSHASGELPAYLATILEQTPTLPASTEPEETQRYQLYALANRLGLYDAADFFRYKTSR